MNKVLWVKFGWSEYYRGGDIAGNFAWLNQNRGTENEGRGHEAYNFMPDVDGTYYCYVPPQGGNLNWSATRLITTTRMDGRLYVWPKIRQPQVYTWSAGTKTQRFMVSGLSAPTTPTSDSKFSPILLMTGHIV
ncbi:hypothetical protein AO063_26380 [Pseudomonas fluorescens ICMP 11288]|uniref:Uncharacterized protein n=1 Tax=Pseudomonas fluorescens ICMP 11288 TaxID=1198309 RepID=A0A0W0H336_PSEFL|nr:hypothetical protein AO063_26380 [Pseudomonas fluorescens ICMP 11288]